MCVVVVGGSGVETGVGDVFLLVMSGINEGCFIVGSWYCCDGDGCEIGVNWYYWCVN